MRKLAVSKNFKLGRYNVVALRPKEYGWNIWGKQPNVHIDVKFGRVRFWKGEKICSHCCDYYFAMIFFLFSTWLTCTDLAGFDEATAQLTFYFVKILARPLGVLYIFHEFGKNLNWLTFNHYTFLWLSIVNIIIFVYVEKGHRKLWFNIYILHQLSSHDGWFCPLHIWKANSHKQPDIFHLYRIKDLIQTISKDEERIYWGNLSFGQQQYSREPVWN